MTFRSMQGEGFGRLTVCSLRLLPPGTGIARAECRICLERPRDSATGDYATYSRGGCTKTSSAGGPHHRVRISREVLSIASASSEGWKKKIMLRHISSMMCSSSFWHKSTRKNIAIQYYLPCKAPTHAEKLMLEYSTCRLCRLGKLRTKCDRVQEGHGEGHEQRTNDSAHGSSTKCSPLSDCSFEGCQVGGSVVGNSGALRNLPHPFLFWIRSC